MCEWVLCVVCVWCVFVACMCVGCVCRLFVFGGCVCCVCGDCVVVCVWSVYGVCECDVAKYIDNLQFHRTISKFLCLHFFGELVLTNPSKDVHLLLIKI